MSETIILALIASIASVGGIIKLWLDFRKWKGEAEEKRKQDYNANIAKARLRLDELETQLWQRTNDITERMEATIKEQRDTIIKKNGHIDALEADGVKKSKRIRALEIAGEEKDHRIQVLEDTVEGLEEQIQAVKRQLKKLVGTGELRELKKT